MWLRKSIHIASGILGLAVLFLPKPAYFSLCAAALVASGITDVIRMRAGLAGPLAWFRKVFKAREERRVSGATALAVSYTFMAGLFPPEVAAFAILFMALGDPAASFFGKFIPIYRVRSKSIGGALGFLLVGLGLSLALPGPSLGIKIFASVIGCLVELFTEDIDDNFTVPISVGLAFLPFLL